MSGANAQKFGSKVILLNGWAITLASNASDPGTAAAGDMYYNTTDNTIHYYNGTAWVSVGSGFAETSLNNLSAVAINTSLLPASTSTINLGSPSFSWEYAYLDYLATPSSGLTVVNVGTQQLLDTSTEKSIDWTNRQLYDSTGSTVQLSWSTTGVTIDKALLLNGSTSGALTIEAAATTTSYTLTMPAAQGSAGQVLTDSDGAGTLTWTTPGSGTVTSVSVVSTNGFAGTVATSTSTPAITIETTINSPVLAGNGTAISAATTTGTGSTVVLSASPTISGTLSTSAISASGALNMNSNQINNLAMAGSPAGTDATNVTYVNAQISAAINGLTWKGPVSAYATSNVPLTGGATLTIDSYAVQNGNYVILSNQTTASQNNVYVASGIGSAYTLSLAPSSELTTAIGDAYLIENGTVWANSAVQANAISPNNTYIQFAGPNFYTFMSPLSLTGTTVSLGYDNSTIGVNGSNQIYVKNNGITYTQFQQVAASSLVGNPTGSTANAEGITLGATLTFSGTVLETVAMTGDVTTSANSFSTTVAKIQGVSVGTPTGTGNVVFSASPTLTGTITAAAANFSGAIGANGGITSTGALLINVDGGAAALQVESTSFQRSTNGTNFITETYVDSTTLTDNSGPTAVTAFQFAVASFAGIEITYVIEAPDGANTGDTRIGKIRVTANSTGTITPSITDDYTESADCGVTWTATNSSGTISVNYTTTNQGANRTMRSDVKFFRR